MVPSWCQAREKSGALKTRLGTHVSRQKSGSGPAAGSYTWVMGVTVELPEDVVRRLTAEAQRRGVSIDVIISELAAQLPGEDALEAFIGCGASGRTEPFDIRAERAELAAERLAEGA